MEGSSRAGLVRWLRLAAAFVVAAAIGACSPTGPFVSSGPPQAVSPAPSLPGTPGHFDDGRFSFDYPTDWPVIAADQSIDLMVVHLVAVLGIGSWHENCTGGTTWQECGFDTFDVPAGGVLVKVYWRAGGPPPICWGNVEANATLGPNAVQKTTEGSTTSWEVHTPGGQFGWPNNPTFEVHTSDAAQLAKAEAMVASFRWNPSERGYGETCSPSPVESPAA